jgi:O-antigen ligase
VNVAAVNLSQLTVTQISVAAGGLVALVAYVALIVVPAWGSYGRWWERFAASFMTLFILVTLVGIGAGIGAAIIWSWGRI